MTDDILLNHDDERAHYKEKLPTAAKRKQHQSNDRCCYTFIRHGIAHESDV